MNKGSLAGVLGDYEMIEELQDAVWGKLLLAEHTLLKKPFFLHVPKEDFPENKNWAERFVIEIAKVSVLSHPHIAKTENASQADGIYFFATEAILGEHGEVPELNSYLERRGNPLAEEEVYTVLEQLAGALDYAHHICGVFHGGIQPANILVRKKEGIIEAILTNFGLTRFVGEGHLLAQSFLAFCKRLNEEDIASKAKLFIDHFAYLSPEQKIGAPGFCASDSYALGVVIYELLMGRRPEGIFFPPSKEGKHFRYNWDLFFDHVLRLEVAQRPSHLLPLVKEMALCSEQGKIEVSETILQPILKPQELARPEFIADPALLFVTDTTIARYQPKEEEKKCIEPILPSMITISGGSYFRGGLRGARDEIPRHAINIPNFAIDIHPVTNEEFVRFLEAMEGEKDVSNNDMIRLRDARIKRTGGKLSIESGYARHPVVGVSWYGALAYAKWVGKRLPTEAEWEIAAASGREEFYPTGETIERSQANFFSSDTTAVMSYPPNAIGLYDMAGNVYEWCQDWYGFHYYDVAVQEPNNPQGPAQGIYRVLKGGCWKSLKDDLRCGHRHRNNPGTMNATYGFRCAADAL